MKQQLIIFIKNPVKGQVKTRIAYTEGEEVALKIYQELLDKCLEETSKVEAVRHLFYSEEIEEDDIWTRTHYLKHLQKQDPDLGERMHDAFNQLQQAGQAKTIIIGSDCYDLTAEIIHQAYQRLDQTDLVFGPANDGGYYLLGMKEFHSSLFQGISWSSPLVLEQSCRIAKNEGLTYSLLDELIDLDTIDDVKKSSYPYGLKKRVDD